MNFRKLLYIVVLIIAAAACKKDEDYTTTPTLNGSLSIVGLPEFIAPGAKVTLTPRGVTHPDGEEIKYTWKVSPSQTKYDTMDVFTHTFSDTLRTYNVYCNAQAKGYTTMAAVSYTTMVAPGYNGSLQGVSYKKIADDSTYVRHMPYYYRQIGTQTWTLNNMAVRSGIPFRNAEVMSEVFGRFYNFDEAKAACDSLDTGNQNWELPSMQDWALLETYISSQTGEGKDFGKSVASALMGNISFNGSLMWEYWPVVGKIKNSTGFSAFPAGYSNNEAKSFDGEFEYAAFWTSDSITETEAYYKYLICDQPGIFTGKGSRKSFGASVRCIRK